MTFAGVSTYTETNTTLQLGSSDSQFISPPHQLILPTARHSQIQFESDSQRTGSEGFGQGRDLLETLIIGLLIVLVRFDHDDAGGPL